MKRQRRLCRATCAGAPDTPRSSRRWRRLPSTFRAKKPKQLEFAPQRSSIDLAVVGKRLPKLDAPDKATGRALYTDDLVLPNMIHGKLLLSPLPHATIKSIGTAAAEALPGVKVVLTGRDVPDIIYGTSPARYDETVLAKDKVRYVGDPVAAVAAVDEETCYRALELIQVEYEELPAVLRSVRGHGRGCATALRRPVRAQHQHPGRSPLRRRGEGVRGSRPRQGGPLRRQPHLPESAGTPLCHRRVEPCRTR